MSPREKLRAAVKAAGGTNVIAAAIGTSASHVSNLICGHRPVGRETAAKLRPLLPGIGADVWLDLLAPMPTPTIEESQEAAS